MLIWYPYIFCDEVSIKSFANFLPGLFPYCWVLRILNILDIHILYRIYVLPILLPSCVLSFYYLNSVFKKQTFFILSRWFCVKENLTQSQAKNKQTKKVYFLSNIGTFFFLAWLHWLKPLGQSWIDMVRVDIIIMFYILEENHSAFCH